MDDEQADPKAFASVPRLARAVVASVARMCKKLEKAFTLTLRIKGVPILTTRRGRVKEEPSKPEDPWV